MFRFILVTSALIACACAGALNSDILATGNSYLDITPEGNYQYSLETSNGISAQESGLAGHSVQGKSSYYSPEGELIEVFYVADENGYQPQGSHLPTPPPIPAAIQKSLEYIRTHPQYDEAQQQHHQQQPHRQQQQHRASSFGKPTKYFG
ncbi:pupal cuticle protein Edg-78E-like [Drosophila innubila]|uniref:pupal cuticle protein Edg-78E-like n=1 Tax=Drosophila innubila TaxID=198719 RepID=UPI00148E3732|nr:pupal cuticle protein Edg-78E-like [Drosophila innubila]